MKHILLSLILLIGVAACSSKEKDKNAVNKMAQQFEPVVDHDAQIARVKMMIQTDESLHENKKKQLIELVDQQSKKITEFKEEQSRLRAVLINQLLQGSDGALTSTVATTKELEKLNKKNIKGLNDFILKFRSISGERDARQNAFMREVGNIHML
jgi:hypothetical protein